MEVGPKVTDTQRGYDWDHGYRHGRSLKALEGLQLVSAIARTRKGAVACAWRQGAAGQPWYFMYSENTRAGTTRAGGYCRQGQVAPHSPIYGHPHLPNSTYLLATCCSFLFLTGQCSRAGP